MAAHQGVPTGPPQHGDPMTNKITRTYWLFAYTDGQYRIGIATTSEWAAAYATEGYKRSTRDDVVRHLLKSPALAVTIDLNPLQRDQKTFVKNLRAKKALDIAA
jgi:hypothetical protein